MTAPNGPPNREGSAKALEAFERLLGAEHVIRDADRVRAANTTTYATRFSGSAIVRPGTVAEVQGCLRIANEHRAPIYVNARGQNIGYGCRAPSGNVTAYLDLSRLDRISDFDETMGAVTVQPGVTFAQLTAFLREKGGRWIPSITGGPPIASVMANAIERGIGKGPYSERFAFSSGFEVVLPTGELLHTAFGRFAGAALGKIGRYGVGPFLDGIFTQSNLGVVTSMTILLFPVTEHATSFLYSVREHAQMPALVDALRDLRLEATVRCSYLLTNDVRRMSFTGQYPFAETGGKTPLPDEVRRKHRGAGAWAGDGALFPASAEQLRADKARVRAVLEGKVDTLVFTDEPEATKIFPPEAIQIIHGIATGVPLTTSVRSAYWRKKEPAPMDDLDPDRDGCGFISLSPAIPFVGADARRAVDILEKGMLAYGFDPSIALNCSTERVIDMTPWILFDRNIPGEDERAMACHDRMVEELAAVGYYPYRLATEAMDKLPTTPDDGYVQAVKALKKALDPNDILSPGRYDFRHEWG